MDCSSFAFLCLKPSCINAKNGGFDWFDCVQVSVKQKLIMLSLEAGDKLDNVLKGKPVHFMEQRCGPLQDELAI